MATTPSVRIVKRFGFKGGQREWSNRYHFLGGTPPDNAHWITLFDAITAAEKLVHAGNNTIVEAVGYAAGSDVAVTQKVYSLAGTLTPGGADQDSPGEVAGLVRYATAARSIKNHPIYGFSYYHGVYYNPSTNVDTWGLASRNAHDTYANAWLAGFSDGGSVLAKRCTQGGHACVSHICEEYLTHRDFPPTTSV